MYFDKTKMDWNNLNHHFIVYQVIGSLYSDVMSAENIGGITVYTLLLFRKQYLWFLYLRAIFSTFSFSLPAVKLSGILYFFIASVGLFIEN